MPDLPSATALKSYDVAGDGQAQAGVAGVPSASLIETDIMLPA